MCVFPFLVGFTKWLNFVLTPPDVSDSSLQVDIHKGKECFTKLELITLALGGDIKFTEQRTVALPVILQRCH